MCESNFRFDSIAREFDKTPSNSNGTWFWSIGATYRPCESEFVLIEIVSFYNIEIYIFWQLVALKVPIIIAKLFSLILWTINPTFVFFDAVINKYM